MIQFGLYNSVASPPAGEEIVRAVAEAIREAEVAETAGFDGCFVGEHHQDPKGFLPSPMMLLSAIAARTTRLKVGTGVLLLPLHDPYRVAEYAATLDVISKGRAILGVGVGYQPNDFAPFGVAVKDRGAVMDESLGIVRALLEQERVTHKGPRFTHDNLTVTPRPVQKPRPEIWVTGWSPAGIRRAARYGDRWFPDPLQHMAIITRLVETYRAEVKKQGGVPRVALFRDAWVAPRVRPPSRSTARSCCRSRSTTGRTAPTTTPTPCCRPSRTRTTSPSSAWRRTGSSSGRPPTAWSRCSAGTARSAPIISCCAFATRTRAGRPTPPCAGPSSCSAPRSFDH